MKDLQFPQVNQKNLHKTPSLSELQLPSQYTKELKKKIQAYQNYGNLDDQYAIPFST